MSSKIYVEYEDGSVNTFGLEDNDPIECDTGYYYTIAGVSRGPMGGYDTMVEAIGLDCHASESSIPHEGASTWFTDYMQERYGIPWPGNYGYAVPEYHTVGAEFDPVQRPSHYTEGRTVEPIDAIMDWDLDFLDGQVVKYVSRAGRKGEALEDYRKAEFYLKKKIAQLEKEED